MNANDALQNIINMAGIYLHKDDFLSREYAGFDNMLKKLIIMGEVIIPKNPHIQGHFEKFSYCKIEDVEQSIDCVKIKFLKHDFKKSNLFKEYFEQYFQEAKQNYENTSKTYELVQSCKSQLNI